ncbi:tRNA uracil 4-sulfurtransferase ThiI [Aneurinibacillus thermoaerophilus]|uniref:tRNA uracil 4-sulfurtransferase ThiI n=1 Tax=Aneurinibacillus thermoaerophilus TaxID=143495 RepID=UPI002E20E802|nr:tRNA uracil 4-sulfurtransferase ThiI [Aneurinibacillus thermoaerophilus]MED0676625.1 tRNA 4-thiouridine(8) synthase ThiI [Aneurinibacillus thermoaerophilus]MED0738041.1 tRNA 4-thiouridine(8) synthase ThiI [Aneurinibacillus thermoaerophilus]
MQYEHILIRYGELALKKRNRGDFEAQLVRNIKKSLQAHPNVQVERVYGRLYLVLNGEPYEQVAEKLKKVFGIYSFSPTRFLKTFELETIQQAALEVLRDVEPVPRTFKVTVKRPNKQFPYRSQEMNHLVGSYILRNTENIKVDVHHPEVELVVEIRIEGVFISCRTIRGMGGLPTGSSGKAMLMLSGGIDSPVAGWMTMKRGVRIEGVHFHSYPFTSERAKQKVIDLARILSQYSGGMKLHIVPFTEIQTQIRQHCPEHYMITIMRRFMMRITERLAQKHGALAIATGESLGQVASQTMESMYTINSAIHTPVIRPLIAMDKEEIMAISRRIGTYETSILPYEDCCTIFVPKSPVTKPKPEQAEKFERALDVERLIEEAVNGVETIWIEFGDEKVEHQNFF